MYFFEDSLDQERFPSFAAFSGPSDEAMMRIQAALKLRPIGGYVKGSAARKALEEAVTSVPLTSASEIKLELTRGKGPTGQLFRNRLSPALQAEMVGILERKVIALGQQQEAERRRREAEKASQNEARLKERQAEAKGLCERLTQLHKESDEAVTLGTEASRKRDWKGEREYSAKMRVAERKIAEVIRRLTELDFACIDGRLQSVPRPALKSY
jgi:hypothetical protein